MINKTCENCLFSAKMQSGPILDVKNGAPLQCKRFPPVPFPVFDGKQLQQMNLSPVVAKGDNCGEWTPDESFSEIMAKSIDELFDGVKDC